MSKEIQTCLCLLSPFLLFAAFVAYAGGKRLLAGKDEGGEK